MKIGAFVKNHVRAILDHAETTPGQLLHLSDPRFCKSTFNLNWPFFALASSIQPPESMRYWQTIYPSAGGGLRVCSQWYDKDRRHFEHYLESIGVSFTDFRNSEYVIAPSPNQRAEKSRIKADWKATQSIKNSRYRSTHVGNAQNALIRAILGRVGIETFSQNDWDETKRFFGGACAYCRSEAELQIDHGIPINLDMLGEHRLGNLIPSCRTCNALKHDTGFREFLSDKHEQIAKIEAYMDSRGYVPLVHNAHVKLLLNQARDEVKNMAERYIESINSIVETKTVDG